MRKLSSELLLPHLVRSLLCVVLLLVHRGDCRLAGRARPEIEVSDTSTSSLDFPVAPANTTSRSAASAAAARTHRQLQDITEPVQQLAANYNDDDVINFVGFRIPRHKWIHDVRNIAKCWSDTGTWKFNETKPDPSTETAPCGYNVPMHNQCRTLYLTNTTRYYWESHGCRQELVPFDIPGMCELMEGRGNIMLVGDSVSVESHLAFETYFARMLRRDCPATEELPDCRGLRMYSDRNDRLSLRTVAYVNETEKMKEFPWITKVGRRNVSLLILNRGAHYETDDKLLHDVNETMFYLRHNYPNISVIWRNTPHGNIYFRYMAAEPPLKAPPKLADTEKWYYGRFQEQNLLIKDFLEKHYEEVFFFDVFTSTVLRGDGHRDELHLCVAGGPMDNWLKLLYNSLLLIRNVALNSLP